MQPESRESYVAGLARLEALIAAHRDPDGARVLASLGDEILAVADLLRGQPRLRRALSDPGRGGHDRVALLRSLLDNRISANAVAVVGELVTGRWSAPSELLDATERLGVEALLASADAAGELADVEDELFRFGKIVDAYPTLAAELAPAAGPTQRRARLVHALLTGKAKPATVRLADLALHGLSGRNLSNSLSRLVELAAARRDHQIAYVTVAAALTDAQERRLGGALSQMYGRQIETKIVVVPEVLGGVSVRVGHDLYDGTVLRRLNRARAALAGKR
jgi:F-type H+-transporting ATPase subunit delta